VIYQNDEREEELFTPRYTPNGAYNTVNGPEVVPEDPDLVKPVYLKGIFSASTTSTRPLLEIRADIKRVLKLLGADYCEIKGGFSCSHESSIAVVSRDRDGEDPTVAEIKFKILIVKVPIVSLHGVQFKWVRGNISHYVEMARQILNELRV